MKEKSIEGQNNQISLCEKFLSLRKISSKIKPEPEILPPQILFHLDDVSINQLYSTATNLWTQTINQNNFLDLISKNIDSHQNYPQEIHKKLKIIRVTGVVLRDAKRLFSQDHQNPPGFFSLIKKLGKINDYFNDSNKDSSPEEILSDFKKADEENHKPFKACKPESLTSFLNTQITTLNSLLSLPELSFKQIHLLRKTHRIFLSYFLLATLQSSTLNQDFYQYIYLRGVDNILENTLKNPSQNAYIVPESGVQSIKYFLGKINI